MPNIIKKFLASSTFLCHLAAKRWSWLLGGIVSVAAVNAHAVVVEFFDPDLNNYFITADPTEQAFVDSGAVGRWQRTGNTFAAGGPNQVCRFYGNSNINQVTGVFYGPNSHFYTADPAECAGLKAQYTPTAKSWKFESNDFLTTSAVNGTCPVSLVPVYRAYNNGFAKGVDSNHRITSNVAAYQLTVTAGSIGEGIVMCAPAGSETSPPLLLSPDGMTVHDAVNNISWLADFNLPASNRFGLPLCTGPTADRKTCVNASGLMSYQAAAAWVNAMNTANYLGHRNWQLPTTPITDSGCGKIGPSGNSFGFKCTASALGSLYYNAFGLKAPNTAVPIPSNTVGPFSDFQPYLYWSQTVAIQASFGYATFSFNSGFQGANTGPNFLYALPMIPGKLSGTPPATGNGLEVNPDRQTVYDPVTNVTWLANANLAVTNTFGLPSCQDTTIPTICVNRDGSMTWDSASQFVANMNAGAGYLGKKNWQLPPSDHSCTGYNCVSIGSPMAELFYGQLGLSQGTPVVVTPNIDVGPFNNLQSYLYWACQGATIQDACQTDGPASGFEWTFSFGNGFLGTDLLQNDFYATAYFVGPNTPTSGAAN